MERSEALAALRYEKANQQGRRRGHIQKFGRSPLCFIRKQSGEGSPHSIRCRDFQYWTGGAIWKSNLPKNFCLSAYFLFFLRVLRLFVVDFHCFSHTSTIAAPQAASGFEKLFVFIHFDD